MEIIGWIGTALVVIAYYPQIHHLWAEKCAWGISVTNVGDLAYCRCVPIDLRYYGREHFIRFRSGDQYNGNRCHDHSCEEKQQNFSVSLEDGSRRGNIPDLMTYAEDQDNQRQ